MMMLIIISQINRLVRFLWRSEDISGPDSVSVFWLKCDERNNLFISKTALQLLILSTLIYTFFLFDEVQCERNTLYVEKCLQSWAQQCYRPCAGFFLLSTLRSCLWSLYKHDNVSVHQNPVLASKSGALKHKTRVKNIFKLQEDSRRKFKLIESLQSGDLSSGRLELGLRELKDLRIISALLLLISQ